MGATPVPIVSLGPIQFRPPPGGRRRDVLTGSSFSRLPAGAAGRQRVTGRTGAWLWAPGGAPSPAARWRPNFAQKRPPSRARATSPIWARLDRNGPARGAARFRGRRGTGRRTQNNNTARGSTRGDKTPAAGGCSHFSKRQRAGETLAPIIHFGPANSQTGPPFVGRPLAGRRSERAEQMAVAGRQRAGRPLGASWSGRQPTGPRARGPARPHLAPVSGRLGVTALASQARAPHPSSWRLPAPPVVHRGHRWPAPDASPI